MCTHPVTTSTPNLLNLLMHWVRPRSLKCNRALLCKGGIDSLCTHYAAKGERVGSLEAYVVIRELPGFALVNISNG